MTTIRPGEFWVADIPFTSGAASKKRPILVLWLDAADVVVAAVTTALPRSATDVPLAKWQASGLVRTSTVRLSRLDSLERSLLLRQIGMIDPTDAQAIKAVWQKNVHPQF